MSDSGSFSELVMELAEEFLERYRNGERPPLAEYIEKHAHLADEIREVFPAMAMMENIAIDDETLAAGGKGAGEAELSLKQIGDYRILREAGRGGMGIVYEAEQLSLGRRVAVKVLPQQALLDKKHKSRFEREARAAARLHHTNIVPVFGIGEQDGMHYYVMQFIQGLGLDEVLDELRQMKENSESPRSATPGELAVSRRSGEFSAARVARSLVSGQFEQTILGDLDAEDGESSRLGSTIGFDPHKADAHLEMRQSGDGTREIVMESAGLGDTQAGAMSDVTSGSLSLSDSLSLSAHSDGSVTSSAARAKRKQTFFTSVANIGRQVASALQYAHEQGITHRDIKPSNLLLDMHGTVWVTDFGLAKANDQDDITHTGDILGTLRYMPPEAFEGRSDAKGDQYSLGLTLYELLAQKPAFEERDRHKLIKLVTTTEPVRIERLNPDVPRDLATIIHKSIDRDPSHRYTSAKELGEDLQRFLEDEPIKARRISTRERLARWSRRNRGLAASLAAVCVLLLVINIAGPAITWHVSQLNEVLEEKQGELGDTIASLEQTQGELEDERDRANIQAAEMHDLAGEMASLAADEIAAREEASRLLYATDMQLAAQFWRNDEATAAEVRDRLEAHVPEVGEQDRRGFEWYYHDYLINHSATILRHPADVLAAAMTDDGDLVTLDQHVRLRRWNLNTRRETATVDLRYDRRTGSTALAPDGKRAALVVDTTIHLVDTGTGQDVLRIESDSAFSVIAFSGDGRTLVTVNDEFQKINWWDTATGALRGAHDVNFQRAPALSLSRDGLVVAVHGYGSYGRFLSILRLDAVTNEVSSTQRRFGGTQGPGALSPDGTLVATCYAFSGSITVFETEDLATVAHNGTAHASPPTAMVFSADGGQLITAAGDGTIRIWPNARKLDDSERTLKGHEGPVNHLELAPAGNLLVSTSADDTARVWDLRQPDEAMRALVGTESYVQDAAFSPDGLLVAVPDGSQVSLHDAATGERVRTLPSPEGSAFSVAISPDGDVLAVGYGNGIGEPAVSYVLLWDIDTGEQLRRLTGVTDIPGFSPDENNATVGALAFSPDGRYLVAGFGRPTLFTSDRSANPVKVWEAATGRLIRRLEGHLGYCVSLDFSDDGELLASGSYDGTARIWTTRTWQTLHTLRNPDPLDTEGFRRIAEVAFSPDGPLLALASREGGVVLWNFESGTHDVLAGHSTAVQAVAFSPDGRTLATSSGDETLRFWNVETRRQVLRLRFGDVQAIEFSPDGRQLLAGGSVDAIWSSIPPLWDEPEMAGEKLGQLLESGSGFQSKIRMLSENLRLHEALEILQREQPDDVRIQAALAAARANWHASRDEWQQAAAEYDRLAALTPGAAEGWLRTPGLLRLATALLQEERAVEAAGQLTGGAGRRTEDSLAPAMKTVGLGFSNSVVNDEVRIVRVYPGSPAGRSNIQLGDAVLKVNDTELTPDTIPQLGELIGGDAGSVVQLTVRHPDTDQTEVIELVREEFFFDPATDDLLNPLREAIDERLSESPRDPGLLELRAELAGQWSGFEEQVADYTAAIEVLLESADEETPADLARLRRRRGDAYVALEQWQEAADDYSDVVTDDTTDETLLTSQAIAQSKLLMADDWSIVRPYSIESLSGAPLTLLDDGSILASGDTPDDEMYTVSFRLEGPQIAGIVLETLPHSSLPRGAAGRESRLGAFLIAEVGINSLTGSGEPVPVPIGRAWADDFLLQGDDGQSHDIGYTIDDDPATHWTTYPNQDQPHIVLYRIEEPIPNTGDTRLQITIDCRDPRWKKHALGCFRLSTFARPETFERRDRRVAMDLNDPWVRLAAAYWLDDEQQAIDQLVERRPQIAGPAGDLFADDEDWDRALAIYSLGINDETSDVELLSSRARACEQLEAWDAAAADWARVAAESPDGATLLAEFAARLAEHSQTQLALDHYAQARRLREQALARDPGSPLIAEELARVMLEEIELEQATDWTTLSPAEAVSEGGATFTIEDDGSLFVSGENLDVDTYTLTTPVDTRAIHALKLEVIPDDRLPAGRAGRAANGNFRLGEIEAELISAKDGTQHPLAILNAVADGVDDVSRIGDGDPSTFWQTWELPHTLVIGVAAPQTSSVGDLRIRLKFADGRVDGLNLGRFRLSMTGNPGALIRARALMTEAVNPWVKLALATALEGRLDEAARIAARACFELESWDARKAYIEQLGEFDELLSAVARRHPDDPQLQLALAREAATAGRERLDLDDAAAAIPALEQARGMFTRLLAESPERNWTVVTPVDMQSEGGATLTLQEDGSILAGGVNPNAELCTITVRPDVERITGIRLEALRHPSLPQTGPGRNSSGNFHLHELKVYSADAPAGLTDIVVDYDQLGQCQHVIDGAISRQHWSIWPRVGEAHTAVISCDLPHNRGDELTFELYSSRHPDYGMHSPGCFRLSVTSDPDPLAPSQLRFDLENDERVELYAALGKAYGLQARPDEATAAFAEGLNIADDRDAIAGIIEAAAVEGLLERLAERAQGQALFQAALTRHYVHQDQPPLAAAARARAITLLERELAENPGDSLLPAELADVLLADTTDWTVLEPVKMTSAGGATLTRLDDDSILAGGENTLGDAYTIVAEADVSTVHVIRLEALTHPSLPNQGPGRDEERDPGNFAMTDWEILAGNDHIDLEHVRLSQAAADVAAPDPVSVTGWNTGGAGSQPHTAYFRTEQPVEFGRRARFEFRMQFSDNADWPLQNLGRFRLSVSDDPLAFDVNEQRLVVAGIEDPLVRLGAAYALAGDTEVATGHFARAFESATSDAARSRIGEQLAAYGEIVMSLATSRPDDPHLQIALGRHLASKGDWDEASAAFARAVQLDGNAMPDWIQTGFWAVERYPNDLTTAYPPEQDPDPFKPVARFAADGTSQPDELEWRPIVPNADGLIRFSNDLNCCNYALTYIWSPDEQTIACQLGDDDALRLFVNGEMLLETRSSGSGAQPGEHKIPVPFKSGWNSVLLKVWNWEQECAAILALSNAPLDLAAAETGARLHQAEVVHSEGRTDAAISILSELIDDDPDNSDLLVARAEMHGQLQQWDLAKADCLRAVELRPDLIDGAFERYQQLERWGDAADLGWMLIDQRPNDSYRWIRVAPVLVLADREGEYADFCDRMVGQFSDTEDVVALQRVCHACLLKPDVVDVSRMPRSALAGMLEDGQPLPEWFPQWGWSSLALAAVRSGEPELALEYVEEAEQHAPSEQAHAMILAIVAMAEHQLQDHAAARRAVEDLSEFASRQAYQEFNNQDQLIPGILLREAETLISEPELNGQDKS